MRRTPGILLLGSLLAAPSCAPRRADLVVYGRIWTGDSTRPWAEALAARGPSIVAVGSRAEIERLVSPATRVMDNGRNLVTPGFGDAHVHLIEGGFQLMSVDLRDADTPQEFVRRLAVFARRLPAGRWITGGDWDHERWPGSPLPRREWIDSVTPSNPVFISRLDGHMALANSAALRLAGITRESADPAGGLIVRDARTAEPAGVLKDNAMDAVYRVMPPRSPEAMDTALARAMRHAVEHGVTTVHFVSAGWDDFAALRRARARNVALVRVVLYLRIEDWRAVSDTVRALGPGDDWLRWGGLKGMMDGSLGSTTAAFYQPYVDAPQTRGLLTSDSVTMQELILTADSAGLQLAIHAIGDRANALLLQFVDEAAARNGPRDRRLRDEHAQHLRWSDIPRFGALGVIPSMQPYHAIDDGRWAWKRLDAERLRGTYAFRTLLETGAPLAFGSDWSVAPLDPIWGLYAAVTRRTLDDRNPGGWIPEQKITLDQALRAYTVGVAYAGFMNDRVGTLRPGLLADVVLLDHDLFSLPAESISDARVRATIAGGAVVYERAAL